MAIGCAEDGPIVPEPQPYLDGTPFEYNVSFVPRDSVFGTSGVIQGAGASWKFSHSSAAWVLELPTTQVGDIPYGGAGLVVALYSYPFGENGLPEPGQYSIGLATSEYDGRGWLRDPSRVWSTNSAGFFFIDAWHADGSVDGQFALRLERDDVGELSNPMPGQTASAVGTFTARRREP